MFFNMCFISDAYAIKKKQLLESILVCYWCDPMCVKDSIEKKKK